MRDRLVPALSFGALAEQATTAPPSHSPAPPSAAPRHDPEAPADRRLPDGGTFPTAEGSTPRRRELDLRRTPAPGPGILASLRTPLPRRYAVRAFDGKGRITDRPLFGSLGWARGTPVSIHAHDSGVLVVRRDPHGASALTGRAMVAVPAPLLRWCGFGSREQVLLVAVPSLSALVVHGLEVVDRALPDAERMVSQVCPVDEGTGVPGTGPGVSGPGVSGPGVSGPGVRDAGVAGAGREGEVAGG